MYNMKGIKNIVNTDSWKEVEALLLEELKRAGDIKTEGKTNEMIATEVKAIEIANKTITNFLKRLRVIADSGELNEISYK